MARLQSEIFEVNIGGKPTKIMLKAPNQAEIFKLDLLHKKIYTELVRNDVMTEAEARRRFKDTGAWTDKHDKEIEQYSFNVASLTLALEAVLQDKKMEDRKNKIAELCEQLAEERGKQIALIREKAEIFSNTAESLADVQKMHKFVEICAYLAEEDEPLFETRDEYVQFTAEEREAASAIFLKSYEFEYGSPDKISEGWLEVEGERELRKLSEKSDKPRKKKPAKRKKKAVKKAAKES
jgi:hypothetical protein